MRPVKNKWLVIQWVNGRWKPVTKPCHNFEEHRLEFEELRDTAFLHEPPRHYLSIHKCWLDDIANWDGPNGEEPGLFNLDSEIAKLNPHDRREFRKFQRYLSARNKYGDEVLLKRPFWRKYLGLDA